MPRDLRSERHVALDMDDFCCNARCSQGRACPRYRKAEPPLTKDDLLLAALIVAVIALFVFLGPIAQRWVQS